MLRPRSSALAIHDRVSTCALEERHFPREIYETIVADAFENRDGHHSQAMTTNTTQVGQLAFLEARHRAHAYIADPNPAGHWAPPAADPYPHHPTHPPCA